MEGKIFKNTAILRIDKGEEVMESLVAFCKSKNITLANVTGLGASDNVIVACFDNDIKEYVITVYDKDYYEVTNFTGNITLNNGEIYPHLHINFADHKQETFGGHLEKCIISATCEFFLDILEDTVDRTFDEEVGINILKF